jgi:hypothetical protein
MTDERTDLIPLQLDHERSAYLTATIIARGEPILARYAERGPLVILAGWLRPALAAAAIVAGVALGALLAPRPDEAPAVPTTAEALGFPGPVVVWAEAGHAPSLEEIVISLEEASP